MTCAPTETVIRWNTRNTRSGFSLIEILTVVGVTSILIAIAVPTLSSVRSSTRDLVSQVNLYSCLTLVSVYAADNGNKAPVHPHNDGANLSGDYIKYQFPDGTFLSTPYFGQSNYWHARLIEIGYEPTTVVFASKSDNTDTLPKTLWKSNSSYSLSQSFMASPAYWKRSLSQSRDQWQVISLDLTSHPSTKSLLHESTTSLIQRSTRANPLTTPRPIGFVDAHVESRALNDATTPVPNTLYRDFSSPLMTTENGVLGKDF